jgi:hypothetical protein
MTDCTVRHRCTQAEKGAKCKRLPSIVDNPCFSVEKHYIFCGEMAENLSIPGYFLWKSRRLFVDKSSKTCAQPEFKQSVVYSPVDKSRKTVDNFTLPVEKDCNYLQP